MPANPNAGQTALQQVLTDPETYGTTLAALLIDHYGTEALSWSPQTIRLEFQDDLGAEISDENMDKLMAAVCIITSEAFFKNLPTFIKLCNILCGGSLETDTIDLADARECGWGIIEGCMLHPPEEDPQPFSDEICHYIGKVLDHEGINNPPDVLRIGIREAPVNGLNDFLQSSGNSASQQIAAIFKENLAELIQQLKNVPWLSANPDALESLRFG